MFDLENPHQFFKTYDNNHELLCHWTMDLITRRDGKVWVMNHLFINPKLKINSQEYNLQVNDEMNTLKIFGKKSNYPIWPLDPMVIEYFKKHPDFHKFWYHAPADY